MGAERPTPAKNTSAGLLPCCRGIHIVDLLALNVGSIIALAEFRPRAPKTKQSLQAHVYKPHAGAYGGR